MDDAPEKVEIKSVDDMFRVNIEAVYRKRNPAKLKNVPDLIEKYKAKGGIGALYAKVCKQYELDPKVMYATAGFPDDKKED